MCMWIKLSVTDILPLYPITRESEAGGKASLDYVVKPYLQKLKIKKVGGWYKGNFYISN